MENRNNARHLAAESARGQSFSRCLVPDKSCLAASQSHEEAEVLNLIGIGVIKWQCQVEGQGGRAEHRHCNS